MNRYHIAVSPRQVGELAIVTVLNPLENPDSYGKPRPAVLIRPEAGHWKIMGLTTKATYMNSTPRARVPNPSVVGLNGPGHLWGENLTNVSALDIGAHIGWVDLGLADAIIVLANLGAEDARALRAAARLHHPPTGSAA